MPDSLPGARYMRLRTELDELEQEYYKLSRRHPRTALRSGHLQNQLHILATRILEIRRTKSIMSEKKK